MDFQVGFAKKDVTPPLGTLLMGYPRDRISNNVMDKLYASVIAIKQESDTVLLISLDVGTVPNPISDAIRGQLSKDLGISEAGILVFAVHTHSGPITATTPGWGNSNDGFLYKQLIPGAVEAAKEAYVCAQPAVMAIGFADSYAAINRRQIKDGAVILGQNPDGPFNPTMTLVRFQTPAGVPIASFVHYACHATAAGSNWSITRDWPGVVVDHIEQVSGAGCLFINGALGDVGPRLSNGDTGGDRELCVYEIGNIAKMDAQKAYENATTFSVPQVKILSKALSLPFNPAPTLEQVQEKIDALPEVLVDVDIMANAKLQSLKARLESGEKIPTHHCLDQSVIALGELALVPGSFEAFTKVALAIEEGSPYAKTLYVGLCNGYLCYLPTVDQIPFGGYEVASFHASGITGFVDHTCELFVDGVVDLLKRLKHH